MAGVVHSHFSRGRRPIQVHLLLVLVRELVHSHYAVGLSLAARHSVGLLLRLQTASSHGSMLLGFR